MSRDSTSDSTIAGVFDAAPVSLWVEDYSGIKAIFERLRSTGVTDLAAELARKPALVDEAMRAIRVLDVNAFTLTLYRAPSKASFLSRLHDVFRDDVRLHFADELVQMWEDGLRHETEGVNYALDGTPIDILLSRCALPGHEQDWSRVLVSISDITARKEAERARADSESHARGLFEHSPVSLWVEDYTGIRRLFDALRNAGVVELGPYLRLHPGFVHECIAAIRVIDVNQRTLKLFRAPTKDALFANLDQVFGREMSEHFAEELMDMWTGRMVYECEGVNFALTGEPIDIHLQRSVLPGSEDSWARVLISITDISARKKAEAYMQFLGTHDVLTGMYNRAYFDQAVQRLTVERFETTSIVIADLDGLKQANDALGHNAGDALIRRAAEVLNKAVESHDVAARIGGDEFALLLVGKDDEAAQGTIDQIRKLTDVNNQFYQGPKLAMSLGAATCTDPLQFAAAYKLADDRMYADKGSRRR